MRKYFAVAFAAILALVSTLLVQAQNIGGGGTINGNTFTTGTGTLTITGTKTITFNSTSTFTGTDGQTYTFPTTTATLARRDAAQTFTGINTFTSPIVVSAPETMTGDGTPAVTSQYVIANKAGTLTLTLADPATNTGRSFTVKTSQAQTVISASANVVPCVTAAAGTAILAGTAGKWATLVSDGTNWVIMACN